MLKDTCTLHSPTPWWCNGCGDCHFRRTTRHLSCATTATAILVVRSPTHPPLITPSGPSPSRPGRTTRFTCTRWSDARTEFLRCALYCYSEERASKRPGRDRQFTLRRAASIYADDMRKLHEGLSRPRTRTGARLCLAADRADPGASASTGARAALHRGQSSPTFPQRQGSGRHRGSLQAPLRGSMLTHRRCLLY